MKKEEKKKRNRNKRRRKKREGPYRVRLVREKKLSYNTQILLYSFVPHNHISITQLIREEKDIGNKKEMGKWRKEEKKKDERLGK